METQNKVVVGIFIVIALIVLLGILVSFIDEDSEVDNQTETIVSSSINEESNYLSSVYIINQGISGTSFIMQDVMIGISDGSITYYDGILLTRQAKGNYELTLESLDSLEVPNKYKEHYKHNRKANVLIIEAMDLIEEALIEDSPIKMNKAASKIYEATNEMNKATNSL